MVDNIHILILFRNDYLQLHHLNHNPNTKEVQLKLYLSISFSLDY